MFKIVIQTLTVFIMSVTFFFLGSSPANASIDGLNRSASPVIDEGNMFSPEDEKALTQAIIANHETYGLSFVVETLPSLNGQNLEETALAHANNLGIGESDKNNGVLILISRDDRKVRFELGRGVSGKVSDADMTRIIDRVVTPEFKSGAYFSGVEAGMVSVGKKYNGITTDLDDDIYAVIAAVILGLGLIAFFLIFAIRYPKGESATKRRNANREYREFKAAVSRLEKIKTHLRDFKYSSEAKAYQSLPDDEARYSYLQTTHPDLAALLKQHSPNATFPTSIVDRAFYQDTHDIPIRFKTKSILPSSSFPASLMNYKLIGKGFEKMSIDAANEIIRKEKVRVEQIRAKELKKKERARKIWDAIPAPTQKALKKAKTQNDRLALLSGQVATDFSNNYSLLASMFLSSSSSSYSSGSYNSSSSSSSGSSSSYSSSSSYDSGSYGGGSFDGGGGSGSW